MGIVFIMIGAQGSGKSYFVEQQLGYVDPVVCSADHYCLNESGHYEWTPEVAAIAHRRCQAKYLDALQGGAKVIVVDNTNINYERMSPYIEGANKFGYKVVGVWMDTKLVDCLARQQHGASDGTVAWFHEQATKNAADWIDCSTDPLLIVFNKHRGWCAMEARVGGVTRFVPSKSASGICGWAVSNPTLQAFVLNLPYDKRVLQPSQF